MKRVLLPVLICILLISVSACSSAAVETQSGAPEPEETVEQVPETPEPAAEPESEPEPEPVTAVEFTVEGTYTLFGVLNEGLLVESSVLQMGSDIVLEEGGTGSVSLESERVDITKWEMNEDTVSLTLADGGEADAKYHDGILDLDLYGDGSMVLYYGQEGADLSGYQFLTLEEVQEQLYGNQ